LNPLSAVYGQVTRFRRNWYERRPHRRRQLGIPVISVGNLVVGGSGKTPVVATLARLLHDAGYRPAVISRGYKRRHATEGAAIVSDGVSVLATVDVSGDEPQLLARRLGGVPIVVGANRYDAGVVARDWLGANVLILDDGFQHLPVARTVDLLLLSDADVSEQVLPAGRLREPLAAARGADALLVPGDAAESAHLARRIGVEPAFGVSVDYQPLRLVTPFGAAIAQPPHRVLVLAAIARPERFVDAVRELGYSVAQAITFRDHHWFTASEMHRVRQQARDAGADAILTTEKDAVRLAPDAGPGDVPLMYLPIDARIEPADAFSRWLFDRIGPPQVRR
jgi:tetraacyldisaccharide 4'-kinase